jgi:hypothetical protein
MIPACLKPLPWNKVRAGASERLTPVAPAKRVYMIRVSEKLAVGQDRRNQGGGH